MKCSLGISNFLEEISSLSNSIVFLYFFALITEEGFLISPCYSLELCIQRAPGCDGTGVAERASPRLRSGVAAETSYPRPRSGTAADRSYPMSKVRGSRREELPHL